MFPFYKDYIWKEGIPHGINRLKEPSNTFCYRIVVSPYNKHISLEKYRGEIFQQTVYDSQSFDFRLLKPESQVGWKKEVLREKTNSESCLIRDQDDRVVILETYFFENKHCRRCLIQTPLLMHIATQKMYYMILDDNFNGAVLYDTENHPVMFKRYDADATGNFTTLLEECWDMKKWDTLKLG